MSSIETSKTAPAGAIIEVVAVTTAYVLISLGFVSMVSFEAAMPVVLAPAERVVGGTFLAGAVIQLALVLAAAWLLRLVDLKRAIGNSFAPATREGWIIAIIATVIHVGTGAFIVLGEPLLLFELSLRNAMLSAVSAPDGWTQEMIFRGYVIFRLARGGVGPVFQIFLSGLLFASIHFGYAGEGFWPFVFPLIGTFVLGVFFAWAVQRSEGSLKPVIVCHIAIIVLLQPWLALVR